MKLADIKVGTEYAFKWGGDRRRGRVTYAGRDREFVVHDNFSTYTRTGPRVWLTEALTGAVVDVPPGSVLHEWSVEQAARDTAAAAKAEGEARLDRLSEWLDTPVRWRFDTHRYRHSTTHVVVEIGALERMAERARS